MRSLSQSPQNAHADGRPAVVSTGPAASAMSALARLTVAAVILAATAAAQTVTYSYDAAGRLVRADLGGGRAVAYTYDAAGNLLSAASESPDHTLRVAVSPASGGSVAGPGIACPGTCVHAFAGTQPVTVTASPAAADLTLLAWAGDLLSADNPFTFTLDADRRITAYFGAASGSTDSDGVPDVGEMGPGGNDPSYDGNGDGVPDYQQAHVTSLSTASGTGYVTLEVPSGQSFVGVQAVANPHPDDAPAVKFPYGFFAFTITGVPAGGVVATLHLPPNPLVASYYKHGPTPDTPAPHWYEFGRSGSTGAEVVQAPTATRVLLHFVDAQRGDDVLSADGMIVDAGGPSVLPAPVIRLDASSLDFGSAPIGSPSSRTVTVGNTGDADLVIGTVGHGDGLAAPFSITADTCSGQTLRPQPAGGTCAVTIRFSPTTEGTFDDTFAIPSNDPARNPATVSVHGEGARVEPIPVLDASSLALLIAALLGVGVAVLRRRG